MSEVRSAGCMYVWCIILVILTLSSCAPLYFETRKPPVEPLKISTLSELPYRELWQGFVFNGEKVGFTHLIIKPIPGSDTFLITSEARLRILFLGMSRQIVMKSEDIVGPDLSLQSFRYEQTVDETLSRIHGCITDGIFRASHESNGKCRHIEKRLDSPLYPASVINLYPVLKGMNIGSRYSYVVFDPQTQAFLTVTQTIKSFEESKKLVVEPSFKVETIMLNHEVSTWINMRGESVFELAMGGVLITYKEDEERARTYLLDAALNKKDLILDYSLVKADTVLTCPRCATLLEIELTGVSGKLSPLTGPGQDVTVSDEGKSEKAVYRITSGGETPIKTEAVPLTEGDRYLYLAPTIHIESDHAEIKNMAARITDGSPLDLDRVRRLTQWVSHEVKDEVVDSTSALDVLRSRRGECQAHTLLYTAMARAAKIPTKLVGGLVYMEDMGFLYHNWAESYVNGWIAVDPTFNQVGVDATHIKLVEGPFWISTLSLGKVIGGVKADIMRYDATCEQAPKQ